MRLFDQWNDTATEDWPWLEDVLTYENGHLVHVLLVSGRWMFRDDMMRLAFRALRWLVDVQTSEDGQFEPVVRLTAALFGGKPRTRLTTLARKDTGIMSTLECTDSPCESATEEEPPGRVPSYFAHQLNAFPHYWLLKEPPVPGPIGPLPRFESLRRARTGSQTRAFRRRLYPDVADADWNDWRWQLVRRIRTRAELERFLVLLPDESAAFDQGGAMLPFGVTPYYMSLVSPLVSF